MAAEIGPGTWVKVVKTHPTHPELVMGRVHMVRAIVESGKCLMCGEISPSLDVVGLESAVERSRLMGFHVVGWCRCGFVPIDGEEKDGADVGAKAPKITKRRPVVIRVLDPEHVTT